jgi:hypothetical protein
MISYQEGTFPSPLATPGDRMQSQPQHLRERGSDAVIDKFLDVSCGLVYLAVGIFVLRKEINAAAGWDKLITLGCVFFAVPLAMFSPEHFRGPQFVKDSVPSWMPVRWFWPYFVGCALVVAATSLILRKCVRLSSTLAVMFSLFVCLIYIPSALENPTQRFA